MNDIRCNYGVNKKKVGILTLYYQNYNYSGLLQAYALQKVLTELGYQAEQISYILASSYRNWNPVKTKIKRPMAYLYHYVKYGSWFRACMIRQDKFDAFAKKFCIQAW